MTTTQTQQWFSPAGAASLLGVPLWVVEYLLTKGAWALHDVRVNGARRIPAREVHAFRRIHLPAPEESP